MNGTSFLEKKELLEKARIQRFEEKVKIKGFEQKLKARKNIFMK